MCESVWCVRDRATERARERETASEREREREREGERESNVYVQYKMAYLKSKPESLVECMTPI